MDCCVQGRAGVPEGQLRQLAVLPLTGVRGWGGRAEEHMSYGWLQVLTRAKEEQHRHLGEVGGVLNVDAEEGREEEGEDASSMRSSKSSGSKGKVGRPRKAPRLPAKLGGQPSAAKPLPAKQAAARVDAWVAAQAGAMPEWQKRAVAVEGEVLLPRGKLQEAEQRATAAERERDLLQAQARKPKPKAGAQGQQQEEQTEGGVTGAGVGAGTKYLMAGSQAWKAQAQKVKGELSAVAATACLLLHQKDGPTFELVVPGYQASLDSHDAVERRYPGDALVEAATNPGLRAPPAPRSSWVWDLHSSYGYSNQMGYQTSDFRLLWTITPNPPPHPQHPFYPPPPVTLRPPPPHVPPNIKLVHCHHTLEV